jgi:UDP-glucose 4-epimerase
MKIVVTGSSGQVGSYIVEHFSKEHEVTGLDNRPCQFPEAAKHGEIADIAKEKDLSRFLKNADWVIHCAAQVSVERSMKDPLFDAENNVIGTVNLLWNSFLHEARNILYVSSAAVYGDPMRVPLGEDHPTNPLSPYGVSKLCGERYALAFAAAYGLSVCVVRPFNIYSSRADPNSPYSGVITKFISRAKEGIPLLIEGDGEQTRDFVHISDVVRMIALIVKKPNMSVGRIFNCGTGKANSILELAGIVQSLSKKKIDIKHVAPRPGDIRQSCADISAAQNLLGYCPGTELKEGIRQLMV